MTLQRVASVGAGLAVAGLLTGCAGGFGASSTALPSPTPGAMPTPTATTSRTSTDTATARRPMVATTSNPPSLTPELIRRLPRFVVPVPSGRSGRYVHKITDTSLTIRTTRTTVT